MALSTFHTPGNNAAATVAAPRAAGAASLTVDDASAFGAAFPVIVTALRGRAVLSILEVTARDGNVLTVSGAIEGTTDAALRAGDRLEMRPTALAVTEIQDAVHGLETDVQDLQVDLTVGLGQVTNLQGRAVASMPPADGQALVWDADLAAWAPTTAVGPQGPAGADGSPGAPGSVLRDGSGAPANTLGIDGDYYLDDLTGDLYHKAAGTYSVVANLRGPAGDTGPAGNDGADGQGVPTGGTAGQALLKVDSTDFHTAWSDLRVTTAQVTGLDAALAARLVAASNLADLAAASAARTNLGLGTAATHADGDYAHSAGDESVGGTKTFLGPYLIVGTVADGSHLLAGGYRNEIFLAFPGDRGAYHTAEGPILFCPGDRGTGDASLTLHADGSATFAGAVGAAGVISGDGSGLTGVTVAPGGSDGSIQYNDGAGGIAGSAATVTAEGAITLTSSTRSPLTAHVGDENFNAADFFNDVYSTTTPIFSYFTRNVGIFEMGTWDAREFRFFTSGYTNSRFIIAANGNCGVGFPSYSYNTATTIPAQFQVVNTNAGQPTFRLVRKTGQSANQLDLVEPDGSTVVGGIGASGAYRLPTLADADAEDNAIFLGSDHPDGAGKPQLCRKQGAVVTVIG